MTDAAKREKVIRGFECCLRNDHYKCPYYSADILDTTCYTRLHTDVLALLKEREARVMTREEVIDLLQGAVVWFEEHSDSGDYLRAMISTGTGFLGDFYLGVNAREVDYKRNRFWTARPTEEQRKAVKWND